MVAVGCQQETQQTPTNVQVTSPVLTVGVADGDGWAVEENDIGHMVSPPVFETYPAWDVTASGAGWADPSSNTIRKVDWSGRE